MLITEKPFFWLSRIPDWAIWLPVSFALGVAAKSVVDSWVWFVAAYFPLALYQGILSNSEKLTGLLVARKGTVAVFWVTTTLAAAVLIAKWYGKDDTQDLSNGGSISESPLLIYLIIGSVLGALLRTSASRLMDLALRGKKRLGLNILLTAQWSATIILFPWEGHRAAAAWFVSGITAGVIVSKSFGIRLSKAAAAFRRIQEISDAWPKGAQVTQAEHEALALLVKGRQLPFMKFKKLRRKLEEWRGTKEFNNRLALISTSVHRIEGNHLGAIAEAELAVDPIEKLEDAHLILFKILSLFELGQDNEAEAHLARLLQTSAGQQCPLAAATAALRAADKALEDIEGAACSGEPLGRVWEALQLRRQVLFERGIELEANQGESRQEGSPRRAEGDSEENLDIMNNFIRKFAGIGIPVTAPFMLDILGYCLLSAGYPEEGRVFIERCIEIDRGYSSAYLHLGDYFICRRALSGLAPPGKNAQTKHEIWHAKACYYTAYFLEAQSTSRVRRRARKRLDQIEKL